MGSWNGGAAELGRPSTATRSNSSQLANSDKQIAMGDDAELQEIQKLGGTAIKPVGWDRTGWEAVQYLIWNPDTGEVLTRTPLSWLKIFVFYCIYYGCLAAFWAAMLNIFFITIPPEHPKWMLEESIIGINPGLGVKLANQDQRIDSGMFILATDGLAATATDPSKNKKGELGE